VGAGLANAMYSLTPLQVSTHHRATPGVLLGEVVATAGLIGLIFALARAGRAPLSAAVVRALYPDVGEATDDVVVAHIDTRP
jgi:hypothetical protein